MIRNFKKYQSKNTYIPKCLSVKEYAYQEEMNEEFRKTMEDGFFVKDNILEDGGKSMLFGVFDGHGGRYCVDYIIQNFEKEFLSLYKLYSKEIERLLEQLFINIDDALKKSGNSMQVGSTACIGFIRLEESKRIIYIANVGDTRAVLCDETSAKRLSYDHKANDSLEIQRIKNAGGNIFLGRVNGVLAISRAFGDHELKEDSEGLTCIPFISKNELRLIHKHLIVATDGLWDVVKDDEIVEIIKGKINTQEMAKILVDTAISRGSVDNISVLVLKLN